MPTLTAPRPTQATTRHTGRTVDTILASPAAVFTGLSGVGGAREAFASYAEEHNLTGHWRLHWNAFRASLESSEAARSESPATEAPSLPLPAAPAAIAAVVLPPEPHREPPTAPKPSRPLIAAIKEADQDFEFYPTTDAIIAALCRSLGVKHTTDGRHPRKTSSFGSILDIGAGNGKVLLAVKENCDIQHLHAIEKSLILCESLPAEILIVGTDFAEQSLFSKQVDVVFCNPPYSQFEVWSERIIREASASCIFLVIPQRWEQSVAIADALKFRDAKARKLGDFDFADAEDRAARAKVHLIRIELQEGEREYNDKTRTHETRSDAFDRFFNQQFGPFIEKFKQAEEDAKGEKESSDSVKGGRRRPFASLVVGANYPEALASLYNAEMANVQRNYDAIGQLDAELLREFEVSPKRIRAMLQTRLSGMRHDYWHELFRHLDTITSRLTSKSRRSLLDVLHNRVDVDFTVTNVCAVMMWVIKNTNRYIDLQLLETYEVMIDKCNAVLYKSNQRTWTDQKWRYCSPDETDKPSHFALDYRIVTHRVGGFGGYYSSDNALNEKACDFLQDLITIAHNLGFDHPTQEHRLTRQGSNSWEAGVKEDFHYDDRKKKRKELLFDVRAFKNRNLHLRLNQRFILALNVEHGRLKGWLNSPQEAATELRDPEAAKFFRSNLQLNAGNPTLLLT